VLASYDTIRDANEKEVDFIAHTRRVWGGGRELKHPSAE
jgi:hypothetical protein